MVVDRPARPPRARWRGSSRCSDEAAVASRRRIGHRVDMVPAHAGIRHAGASGALDADTIAIGIFDGEQAPARVAGAARRAARLRRGAPLVQVARADPRRGQALAAGGPGSARSFTPERARVAAAVASARAREISTRSALLGGPEGRRGRRPPRGGGGDRRGHDPRRLQLRAPQVQRRRRGPARRRPARQLERLIVSGGGRAGDAPSPTAALVARPSTARATCRTGPATTSRRRRSASTPGRSGASIEGLSVQVEGREAIIARGMGAFAAVAQGSDQEPALITIRYESPAAARPDAGLRRQGGDVRQRRHLAEARGEDGGDEVRHVRRRRGDRGGSRDRAPGAAGEAGGGGRGDARTCPAGARSSPATS